MTKLLISGAIALVGAFTPAIAQTTPPPDVGSRTAPAINPVPVVPTKLRVMTNREMTRDEMVSHIRKLFSMFDTNHDGFITREETASAAQGMMAMHGDVTKRLAERGIMMGDRGAVFDRLDANHDGSISRQEFMASQPRVHEQRMIVMHDDNGSASEPAAPRAPGMHGMHMFGMGMGGFGGHLFEMADGNHDGRVSLQEAETAALAHFDRADLNHDGKLTPEERQQAHQLRRQHRAG